MDGVRFCGETLSKFISKYPCIKELRLVNCERHWRNFNYNPMFLVLSELDSLEKLYVKHYGIVLVHLGWGTYVHIILWIPSYSFVVHENYSLFFSEWWRQGFLNWTNVDFNCGFQHNRYIMLVYIPQITKNYSWK